MKITKKLFWKSFLLSFAISIVVASIIITSLYINKTSVNPTGEESTILLGVTSNDKLIALTVVNCNPSNNRIQFLQIPDNTLLSDGKVLQDLFDNNIHLLKQNIEKLIGCKIDRYAFFDMNAISTLNNEIGRFEFLIPYKFVYNDHEHSGQSYMSGELAVAMFTYSGYDGKKVSYAQIGYSYLTSFLAKHATPSSSDRLSEVLISLNDDIKSNFSNKEIIEYCKFISKYSSMYQNTLSIKGITQETSSKVYFTPEQYNSDHNIFNK